MEIRKEDKLGRVYFPAPHLSDETAEFFQDAYEIGYEKIVDTYAAATRHVDQGLSCTWVHPRVLGERSHRPVGRGVVGPPKPSARRQPALTGPVAPAASRGTGLPPRP